MAERGTSDIGSRQGMYSFHQWTASSSLHFGGSVFFRYIHICFPRVDYCWSIGKELFWSQMDRQLALGGIRNDLLESLVHILVDLP